MISMIRTICFTKTHTSYDNKMTWEYNKTKRDQSFPTSFCYPLATNNPPRIQSALLGQLPTPRDPKLAEANLGHPRVREDGHLPPVVSTTSGIPWYFLTEVFFEKKHRDDYQRGRRKKNGLRVGGNSKIFGMFNPIPGVSWSNLTSIFFKWVGSTTN